ncbi:MAG TPA: glutaredoxin family protein [Pyrinomonadaceae bacterium]|nr:glutaredoxin family protein [Pyrinomonadaceae bacterium]
MTSNKTLNPGPRVVIYSRPGCHLCEEAKKVIEASGYREEYTLEEINIESDAELLRRYRYDIPVITINGEEAFRHRVNSSEFVEMMRRAGASPPS